MPHAFTNPESVFFVLFVSLVSFVCERKCMCTKLLINNVSVVNNILSDWLFCLNYLTLAINIFVIVNATMRRLSDTILSRAFKKCINVYLNMDV